MKSKKLFLKLFEKYFNGFNVESGLFGKPAYKSACVLYKQYYSNMKAGLRLCDSLARLDFVDLERDLIEAYGRDWDLILHSKKCI